jgi:hypothetical protein
MVMISWPFDHFEDDGPEFDISNVILAKRLAWTDNVYIALAPLASSLRDFVCFATGGAVPTVLRRVPVGWHHGIDNYRLVGDAYVGGIMDGGVYEDDNCGRMTIVSMARLMPTPSGITTPKRTFAVKNVYNAFTLYTVEW